MIEIEYIEFKDLTQLDEYFTDRCCWVNWLSWHQADSGIDNCKTRRSDIGTAFADIPHFKSTPSLPIQSQKPECGVCAMIPKLAQT